MGFAWCDKGVLARFGDSDGRCAKNGPHAYTHRTHTIAYSGVPQNLTAGSMLYTLYRVITCEARVQSGLPHLSTHIHTAFSLATLTFDKHHKLPYSDTYMLEALHITFTLLLGLWPLLLILLLISLLLVLWNNETPPGKDGNS